MENKLLNINLRIDCHEVRLQVPRDEEPIYRKAALILNKTYQKYLNRYPQLPIEKLWVYSALEIAVELQRDVRDKDMAPIVDRLQQLNQYLSQQINKD